MAEFDIPESWAIGKLADVVSNPKNDIVDGPFGSNLKSNEYKNEGIPVLRLQNVQRDRFVEKNFVFISSAKAKELKRHSYISGDLLITKLGAPLGKACIIPDSIDNGVIVADLVRLRVNELMFDKKFISFQINSFSVIEQFRGHTKGTTRPRVNLGHVRSISIRIPPIGEQKRIVAKIEATQEKIKTIEQSVTKAEELIGKYREALLQKAFRGELVPQDPNDEPASKLLERIRADRAKKTDGKKKKKDDLPPIKPEEIPFEVPKSWEWVRLGEILDKLTDGTHHSPPNSLKGDFMYVSAKHIKNWGLDISDITYVSKSVHDEIYSRCDPKFGDVLLIKDGATTGIAAINNLSEPFSMLSSVGLLRPSKALANMFLLHFLKSPIFQERILGDMAGAAIKRVTLSKLAKMLIPIPPMSEQIAIAETIENTVKTINTLRNNLNELTDKRIALSNSILKNAFSGRLVPQEPSEGTGHELLEKIKSQSTEAPKSPLKKSKPKKRAKA